MGIRIKKVMGYALTDLVVGDTRINWNILSHRYTLEKEHKEWVTEHPKEANALLGSGELGKEMLGAYYSPVTVGSHSIIHFYDESDYGGGEGLPVILLCPCDEPDWFRSDDAIDYYEAGRGSDMTPTCQELPPSGIFPYSGGMYLLPDKTTMLDPPLCKNGIISDIQWYMEMRNRDSRLGEHLRNDYNCKVHPDVHVFVHRAKIFTDPLTVFRLKPVIYTYWR